MTKTLENIIADDGTVLFEVIEPHRISLHNDRFSGVPNTFLIDVACDDEFVFEATIVQHVRQSSNPVLRIDYVSELKEYLAVYHGMNLLHGEGAKNRHAIRGYVSKEDNTDPIIRFGTSGFYGFRSEDLTNMESVSREFWDYARSNYKKIPPIRSFRDLLLFAATFSAQTEGTKKPNNDGEIFKNKKMLELARFIPPFLAQDEIETLADFMSSYEVEPITSPSRDDTVQFLSRNHSKLGTKAVLKEFLAFDKETVSALVHSDYVFASGGSVSSNIFDLKYNLHLKREYKDSNSFLIDFHRSLSVMHQYFADHPDSSAQMEFFNLHSRLMKDHYPAPSMSVESISYMMMVPIWLRKIIENFEVTPSEVENYITFLERSGDWAKADVNSKYVLRRMFKDLPLEDAVLIIDSAIESKALATVNNWFKYIDKYEDHRGVSMSISLQMLS